ncbi:MFS transporter [Nitriliruptoraceae bacterium ZYF776]|nr:MFS transporter [Profundirhabdus halotolerans]
MLTDRVAAVEAALDEVLATAPAAETLLAADAPIVAGSGLTAAVALDRFEDGLRSRAVDVVSRELKARGLGHYTISSAGHEDTALVGGLLRASDPAFLHYRSGALVMAKLRRLQDVDPVHDALLSVVAAADDPASGGRHKVWGSARAWIVPQTSTIGSHLPKAVGTAVTIGRARRAGTDLPIPDDSVVVCSFGDASANHATALAGITAARYSRRRGIPTPIVFVCEDNGIGISVPTPRRWIEDAFAHLPGLTYVRAEGPLDRRHDLVAGAVEHARVARTPVFLHLDTVRLWGHAGSDVESTYRDDEAVLADEARDPLLRTARQLLAVGAASRDHLQGLVAATRAHARACAEEVAGARRLATRAEVVAPLHPGDPAAVADRLPPLREEDRRRVHGGTLPEEARTATRRTLGAHLNAALHDELLRRPEVQVFGEDVGRKGGVYHVTAGLQARFGGARVFDTLLDETTILGLAQGAGLLGGLPVPEIQYLAYLHNALDQLRGEACSTAFFSDGRFRTPMVVRVAGLAYQKGFGGHFHNDHAIGALRDIPGLVLAVPSRGDDAVRMLRGCLALAAEQGRVVAFLEPIALYHERDLHVPGDGGWLSDHPPVDEVLLPGDVGVHHADATDVLLVTSGNGVRLSLRAARRLAEAEGTRCRVLDLRWLNPLPLEAVRAHAAACDAVVVVDECRATGGGVADAVVADLAEHGPSRPVATVRAADSYVPLGAAADLVLVQEDDVFAAVQRLMPTARRSPSR